MLYIVSFFLTTISYGSTQKNFSEYTFFFDLNIWTNFQEPFNSIAIDIDVNTLRNQFTLTDTNISRAKSVHSDIFSTVYTECIQALASWLS